MTTPTQIAQKIKDEIKQLEERGYVQGKIYSHEEIKLKATLTAKKEEWENEIIKLEKAIYNSSKRCIDGNESNVEAHLLREDLRKIIKENKKAVEIANG